MDGSPAKFLFGFLFASIILWTIFVFASRMLAWILSRAMGASVSFRVGGWKCLRDVVVKFNKGAVESVSIGEIRLSIRQSLVKLGVGFISRDPKLQVLICDLEVVMRASSKSTKKVKSRKSRKSGRGKWMVVANMARFLSVSVTELVVKTPKATLEVKELTLDLSKDGGSKPELFVKLLLAPIFVHFGESRVSYDQSSVYAGSFPSNDGLLAMTEKVSAPFSCEEFSITCEFGHDREAGVVVRNVDIATGDVSINLNEELLLKRKGGDAFSSTGTESGTAEKPVKTPANLAIMKYASMFPEKLSFTLPKLDMKFVHREVGLIVENNIMGIQLKGTKSRSFEDVGESTRVDVQMEFSEIHLLKDGGISVVEILKLDVVSSSYIPLQPASPIRSEVDVKLGGTQCNVVMTRLHPWMRVLALRKKKMVLRGESTTSERSHSSDHKAFMWTSTISAPEMTVVLYDLNGSPLYHGCSQSSHVFANNISSTGTVVHMELGEFNLNMSEEYRECLKESLFGVETNMGSLIYIAKVSVDWGKKDMDSPEDSLKYKTVLSVDVTGMSVHLTFRRIGSLVSTALSFKRLLKILSGSGKKPHNQVTKSSKPSGKGIQLIKFNLEKCSLNVCGEVGLENSVVPDPKRANYGSQGGRIVVSVSADGTPRTATITPTAPVELKKLKYSLSLDIFHLNLTLNKEKLSTQMELERARSIYQEHLEDNNLPGARVTLLDMQNAKFVRRSGGLKEIAVCSLFSATDISVRWEPDVYIALVELGLHLKLLMHNQKLQELGKDGLKENGQENETSMESVPLEKRKKRESIFAIDVEMLNISAEVGDGVEMTVQVQSIFSENARIGVLLEGLMLNFNNARIFRSSRMQVSRIPNTSRSAPTAKHEMGTTWDWVIQALDVHICMPYRLELRAIDDSVEEMLRALKLVTAAKTKLLFPKKEEKSKPEETSSSKIGRVRFCIKKLTADIEEQPIQGWLDEHYQLLKKEACELAVRLNFLDELISKGAKSRGVAEKKDSLEGSKIHFNGEEIDVEDTSAIQKLQEEIYKKSFRSYYQACQNLVQSQGSGACSEGFQGGFKPSTARSSLFSVSATELDVSLTRIEGGDSGMIEILQKLDPVCRAHNIPFSRLYGSNINLHTGSLVVRIRNYAYPLLAATSGRCEGRVILAQQATCFQPQIHQNVYIGRWRK
ncbi:Protein KINKY POLLEN, partial [Capsicum annuum]